MHDAIKMIRYNHLSKQLEEVSPDDDFVSIDDLIPLFYIPALDDYAQLPFVSSEKAYNVWCAQRKVIAS